MENTSPLADFTYEEYLTEVQHLRIKSECIKLLESYPHFPYYVTFRKKVSVTFRKNGPARNYLMENERRNERRRLKRALDDSPLTEQDEYQIIKFYEEKNQVVKKSTDGYVSETDEI